jgi:hypothetical protein
MTDALLMVVVLGALVLALVVATVATKRAWHIKVLQSVFKPVRAKKATISPVLA